MFPGILGRTCDRPCEPACRRGRVEENPVAICRLKRVAADFKDDVKHRMPKPLAKNGKRIALVGGGPASLAVARDLAPLGYHCTVFDGDPKAGTFFRADNYPWAKRGVPGLLSVGGPPNAASPDSDAVMASMVDYVTHKYHHVTDEYDPKTWSMDGIEGDARILFEFTWKVADDTRMPNWTWNAPYRALGDARLGR